MEAAAKTITSDVASAVDPDDDDVLDELAADDELAVDELAVEELELVLELDDPHAARPKVMHAAIATARYFLEVFIILMHP